MFRPHLAATAAALALMSAHGAWAHSFDVGALHIGHPWSRPTPPSAPAAAGYLTITNNGKTADRLVSVSTPAAGQAEIHRMSMDGGIMRMRPVAGGLVIAPGATVALAPGGYHLMLMNPTRPFKLGDRIPATLRFEKAGAVKVELVVQAQPPAETAAASADAMAGMPMGAH